MRSNRFNVVWQTLKDRSPKERKARPGWTLIKLLIKCSVLIWKILKVFSGEGDGS